MDTRPGAGFDPNKAAVMAVYKVGPQTYFIQKSKKDVEGSFSVAINGCQGHNDSQQKQVASMMGATDSLLSFILGDNAYKFGFSSPDSEEFHKYFNSIFSLKQKFFLMLGNHDYSIQNDIVAKYGEYVKGINPGRAVGLNQIAHTYYSMHESEINRKTRLFQKETLNLDDLEQWNMPYFFYSLVIGNIQFFCLDTCYFLSDLLRFITKEKEEINPATNQPLENQIAWLLKEIKIAKEAKRSIVTLGHHPRAVAGKKFFPDDYDTIQYLSQKQINAFNRIFSEKIPDYKPTESLYELIDYAFVYLNINPLVSFAAHEHSLSHTNTREINKINPVCQFVAGAGCEDLHPRMSFSNEFLSYFQQHNGFLKVLFNTTKPNTYQVNILTIEGLVHQFTQNSHKPDLDKEEKRAEILTLRECVLSTCEAYFSLLREREHIFLKSLPPVQLVHPQDEPSESITDKTIGTLSFMWSSARSKYNHSTRDTVSEHQNRVIQDMYAFFTQFKMPDYDICLSKLAKLIKELVKVSKAQDPSSIHFFQMLGDKIKIDLQLNLVDIMQYTSPPAMGRKLVNE